MASACLKLPIVDLDKGKSDRSEVARTAVEALEDIGFLYLDNVHGVDHDKLYQCCEWFFKRSDGEKKRLTRKHWERENHNVYRGYFPVIDLAPSRKEGFEIGRDIDDRSLSQYNWFYEPSVWPNEDDSFPFKQYMIESYNALHEASAEFLKLVAFGLGLNENAFEHLFIDKPMSTFRIQHYLSWKDDPPANAVTEDGKIVVTPDHTDSSFLTLLETFNFKGLEVFTPNRIWAPVEPRPQSFIVNIGDVFSKMTGGRFKATRHRVLDIGTDRFSVPFFFEPSYDGDISGNFLSKDSEHGQEFSRKRYGPWLFHRIKYEKQFAEYKDLSAIE